MGGRQSDESERFDRIGYAQPMRRKRTWKLVKGEKDKEESPGYSRARGDQCSRVGVRAAQRERRQFYWESFIETD